MPSWRQQLKLKARVGAVREDVFCSAEAAVRVNGHQGRERAATDLLCLFLYAMLQLPKMLQSNVSSRFESRLCFLRNLFSCRLLHHQQTYGLRSAIPSYPLVSTDVVSLSSFQGLCSTSLPLGSGHPLARCERAKPRDVVVELRSALRLLDKKICWNTRFQVFRVTRSLRITFQIGLGWVSLSGQCLLGAGDCRAWVSICLWTCAHNT